MLPFFTRGFRRPREVVASALGALERQVLEQLWSQGRELTVRELRTIFDDRPAYTTLMTTLDRLFKKGILDRRRDGKAFVYRPRLSREQLQRGVAADVLDGLLGDGPAAARPVLSTLLDAIEERDASLLDDLEALLAVKKRDRKRRPR